MPAWSRFLTTLFVGPIFILLTGCSGDGPFPVSGKITVDGKPISGASVLFSPKDGGGRPAMAETDDSGTYRLMTLAPGDGAMRGQYRVVISWAEKTHPYEQLRAGPQKDALLKEYQEWKRTHKPKDSPIPQKYGEPAATPLEISVPISGSAANFDIKSES